MLNLQQALNAQQMLEPELNPKRFNTEVIHPDEGLASPLLVSLYEDRYGFIWIGSQYGLDRYDGHSFTRMSDIKKDSASTSMEWIWSFSEDIAGNLWVCSSKGLFRFDWRHNSFEMFLPNHDQPESEDNTVYAIYQNSKGVYWVFTAGGLFSYKPETNRFKDYKKDSINTQEEIFGSGVGLSWWNSMRFHEDREGVIWIGSHNGLKKYDPKEDRFLTFRNDPDDPGSLSGNDVGCITEDKDGNLWVSASDQHFNTTASLNRLTDREKGSFQRYLPEDYDPGSPLAEWLWPLYIDHKDNLWIGGKNGFSRYNEEQDDFDNYLIPRLLNTQHRFTENHYISRMMEDSDGKIWFLSAYRGILVFDPESGEASYYHHEQGVTDTPVPDYWLHTFFQDRSGSIWTIGYNGIARSDKLLKPFHTISPEILGLNTIGDMHVTMLYHDRGTLWFGVDDYGLFRSHDFIPGQQAGFELKDPSIRPYCMQRDHIGQLWLGTLDHGIGKVNEKTGYVRWLPHSEDSPTSVSDNYIGYMYQDRRNLFWIGTSSGGLNLFNPETERFIHLLEKQGDISNAAKFEALMIKEDRSGNMWFGGFGTGVSRLEVSEGLTDSIRAVFRGELNLESLEFRFRNFRSNPYDPYSLSGNQINHMHIDRSGRLWIGTTSGLDLFDENNEIFHVYKESDGLPDNCIFGILEDDHGNLWLSTRKGICKVVLEDGIGPGLITSVQSYRKEDGLQGDIFYENTCYKTDEGWMIFGGIHGFTSFHPDSIKRNEYIPPVYITDVLINKESVFSSDHSFLDTGLYETNSIELTHRQNFLAFEYVALNFSNAEQNQYRYYMEGLDETWQEAGDRRYAEYRDMKPGKYIFRVIGSNDDGVWNEEGASIGIIINPPWYRTLLAYILYVLIAAAAVYAFLLWRTRYLRMEKENLEEQVRIRTSTIEEQKEEIMVTNTELSEQKEEILSANSQLQEQKEELEQQKEELQITLDRLRETQAQLIQSEKMAALGGLVAGVAHEINTPVGISLTAASSLEEETIKTADLFKEGKISRADFKEYLNTANQSAKLILSNMQRTADMVQSFKQVSADQSTAQQRKFSLKAYTEDILRSLYPKLKGRSIHISLDIDEKLEIDSYPGAFSQIITNLVLNSLTHGFKEKAKGKIELISHLKGDELVLEYTDDGKGIAAGDLDRIFDPFYTTNRKTGTGLGLHIVYNLVTQKLNGSISCESKPGKGVLFRIILPANGFSI
ncbi:two-component regulator propeller domain-containing protein [Bacteroidota bacterium]